MGLMHIPSMKEITKGRKIVNLKDPDLLMVPLWKTAGSEPEPLVKAGDSVMKYQLLAEADKDYPAKVHSPVSGRVEKISKIPQIDGSEAITIFIKNDNKETETTQSLFAEVPESPKEILKAIEDSGIVGLGGAQFPASIKFDRKDKKVDTFIINGAECEPYLTSDYALMHEYTRELLDGIMIVNRILEAKDIVIGIEKSNEELNEVFASFLKDDKYNKVRIQIVPDEYPQGGELQLTKTITGIEILNNSIPLDKGVIISNVGTIYAVYECITQKKPLIDRLITISGKKIKRPGNYRVKIGTPISHILDACEIDVHDTILVGGGPMMSPQIRSIHVPLNKGSLGILALPREKVDRLNCIWCNYCIDVCPMLLMPMKYDQFFRQQKYSKLEDYNIDDCIECGSCEYICPSNVHLIKSIKEGKEKLKEIKDATS